MFLVNFFEMFFLIFDKENQVILSLLFLLDLGVLYVEGTHWLSSQSEQNKLVHYFLLKFKTIKKIVNRKA